jgi:hypothetical protein
MKAILYFFAVVIAAMSIMPTVPSRLDARPNDDWTPEERDAILDRFNSSGSPCQELFIKCIVVIAAAGSGERVGIPSWLTGPLAATYGPDWMCHCGRVRCTIVETINTTDDIISITYRITYLTCLREPPIINCELLPPGWVCCTRPDPDPYGGLLIWDDGLKECR